MAARYTSNRDRARGYEISCGFPTGRGSNYESSPTDPIPATTGSEPPPCNPDFISDLNHLTKGSWPFPAKTNYCP
jgi:hypothetical protein